MATTIETGTEAERPLPDERLHHILYLLKLARYFDERMEALYRQGRLPGAIYRAEVRRGPTSASSRPSSRPIRCSPRIAT